MLIYVFFYMKKYPTDGGLKGMNNHEKISLIIDVWINGALIKYTTFKQQFVDMMRGFMNYWN